jgi:NitT/TauT family transport system permease protein
MLAADDLAVRTVSVADSPSTDASVSTSRRRRRISARVIFDATWPKFAAVAIFLFAWQCVVWSGWKPEYALPGPRAVASSLWDITEAGLVRRAVGITFQRAIVGFAASIVIGVAIGLAVSSSKIVRRAIGSMITGIQTMPSIAWFPLAIVLFQLDEGAIRFVVILGAAPAIANGLISGIDHVPPLLLRAGQVMGARGVNAYRHVILPATLPSFVGGLKQGWAFAWRSLMAGELLVVIASKPSIGQQMSQARSLSRYSDMMAWMAVVFIIGLIVDSVAFGTLDRAIRRRWGLLTD